MVAERDYMTVDLKVECWDETSAVNSAAWWALEKAASWDLSTVVLWAGEKAGTLADESVELRVA